MNIRDRNVYILGAGFSAPGGVPVIHDFIDRARSYFDEPASGLQDAEREHFERFLAFKRKMSQAREKVKVDLDNIEQLFGLVEISQRLGRENPLTRTSTVYVIAKTLELASRSVRVERIGFQANREVLKKRGGTPIGFELAEGYNEPTLRADLYVYFASLASGLLDDPDRQQCRANTFITFNYDLLLDDALRGVGLAPEYHLDRAYTSIEDGGTSVPRCSLLKLHGSTNWGVCGICGERVIVLTQKLTGAASELSAQDCPKCKQPAFQPLLVPPSWDKSEYRRIMRPIWAKAIEELKLASRICVIGYSMPETDSFFKYLLALGLSENHNLYRFIVVDKNPKMAVRYKQLFDPMFRARRLLQFLDQVGFSAFLSHGMSCAELGRGELAGGNHARW